MLLLYYNSKGKSVYKELQNRLLTVYFDENNRCVAHFEIQQFEPGYYAITVDYERFKVRYPMGDYYIVDASGFFMENWNGAAKYNSLSNCTLIDSDYKHTIVLGAYFPSGGYDALKGEMQFVIHSFPKETDAERINMYARTQSPVFRCPAFPYQSKFFCLYRSSTGANGYDIVLNNIEQQNIEPSGNLVIDLNDAINRTPSGMFILRSRFTRLGLTMVFKNNQFWLMNHSTKPVPINRRMFQYVPLSNFNGEVCTSGSIIETPSSNKLQEEYKIPDNDLFVFGQIIINENHIRESKC